MANPGLHIAPCMYMIYLYTYIINLVGGWATPLKNMKVNWDDEQPNIWENKKWQPNHQPVILYVYILMQVQGGAPK